MKFWLNRDSQFIYLDQFLKATDLYDDYNQIREAIKNGRVKVNEAVEFKRRKMLKEGFTVRCKQQHFIICGDEAAKIEDLKQNATERVIHSNKIQNWVQKPIKKRS